MLTPSLGGGRDAPVVRRGQALVYTGFQWRGRSSAGQERRSARGDVRRARRADDHGPLVHGGGYDETGLDVTLHPHRRASPWCWAWLPRALRAGATASVRIFGVNLDRGGAATDLDFGPGVRVTRASPPPRAASRADRSRSRPRRPRARATCSWPARPLPRAAVVFKTVDALKVTPAGRASRAWAASGSRSGPSSSRRGPGATAPTASPTRRTTSTSARSTVAWSIEEFTATFGDDDKNWVGSIDAEGLFTPAEDGPNPKRPGDRNNVGDLWVVATLPADSPVKPKAPLRARAHLIVTVPLYMRWDQAEVTP